jgi:Na+/proline symporter/nitrogen-specific signal transduction histidine kinase
MFERWELLLTTSGYLLLLFILAYFAELREKKGRSIVANPYVYSLSLAVYCTTWTFYGSVGKAATSGLFFLTIYLGPTLMVLAWTVILPKVISIARENRINTIADFIGSRYGNSLALSALVAIVATIGISPYIGLQIKAIITTYSILTGQGASGAEAGWIATTVIALFAVIFGVKRGVSEKHEGLVFAIAFESIVKLAAFLAVGIFVTYHLFDGYRDIFSRISSIDEFSNLLSLGDSSSMDYMEWTSLMFLSTMAIMFLPRQFQVAVVENHEIGHVRKALWLFPLYLLAINLFVLPVAFGGLLLDTPGAPDSFVLTLPMGHGNKMLALFVFIGGISAASSMIIVESLAISNMVMNSIVTPILYRFNQRRGFSLVINNIKSAIILGLVFVGYVFAVSVGDFYSLVDMGLKSFEAVSIFAPAFLIGLYWKRGNSKGAIAGIAAGFLIWFYTLLVPALFKSGVLENSGFLSYALGSEVLNPLALFGLKGLDRWSHSLFWGLLFNVGLYVGISIFTSRSDEEESQSLLFVESYSPTLGATGVSVEDIEDMLMQFIGQRGAHEVVESFFQRTGADRKRLSPEHMAQLREEARRALSGTLGSTVASVVFRDMLMHTEQERGQLIESIREMGKTLMLSRKELAAANRELALLKAFSENIIESLPLGVATLDGARRVNYWNRAMEGITGHKREEAMGGDFASFFGCLAPGEISEGEIDCSDELRKLKGHVSKLTGGTVGYVIVLEDVTERKRIEDELFLATKHAGIGRLAAGVSHEIGNPLASISSLVQELMSGEAQLPLAESMKTISLHIDRIARIVRNLGDFARLYPRQKQPSSLVETLESTLSLIRYDSNFRNIRINTEIGSIPPLMLDTDQIQQVMLNLFLNSRDAMPEGGEINITVALRGDFVELVFSDTGPGIDEEIEDKVFDPFFSTKGPLRGTGLGLSICYSIIKDHGGSINITRNEGGGSMFVLSFPVDEGAERGGMGNA